MFTATALASHLGGAGFGLGWLFFVIPLFWIGLVVLVVLLTRRRWSRGGWAPGHYPGHHGGHGPWGGAAHHAESTLAERFAQGDIDEKEYRARLDVLRANNTVAPPTP